MDLLKMKQMLVDIKTVLNITPNKCFNIREKALITLEHTTGQADRFTLHTIRLENNNQLVIQCSRGVVIYLDKTLLPYEVVETLFDFIVTTNPDVVFEYCPYCENEAIIPYQMKMGICNHCGTPLAPCSYCADNDDKQDCANCPFNNGQYRHDADNDEKENIIYIVDLNKTSLPYHKVVELSCEEFINLAEEQGNVNTFNGFMQRWNIYHDLPNPLTSIMRVYEQVKIL